jgi:hypothetical protein
MSYEETRRIVDRILAMKHEIPAIQRMLEHVARHARCVVGGECLLEASGRRLVCDKEKCWWEGS